MLWCFKEISRVMRIMELCIVKNPVDTGGKVTY